MPRLKTIQSFVIHYVCKNDENKPPKLLLSGPVEGMFSMCG